MSLVRDWDNQLNCPDMLSRIAISRTLRACFLAAALLFLLPFAGMAHTIPDDVKIQAFAKPEGSRLYLLVRVPSETGTDIDYPQRENAMLDLARVEPTLRDAVTLWFANNFEFYENDSPLPSPRIDQVLPSLASDKSFSSYDKAFAHLIGPRLPNETQVYWEQIYVDVMFEYPIQSDQSRFSFHPRVNNLAARVITDLQFLPPNRAARSYEFLDDPGLIRFDPTWYQSFSQFIALGFSHFLTGTDYWIFLLCLVIPFRNSRALLLMVISFTIAQSIALIAAAYHFAPDSLWFPPLIETLLAIAIVYLALENIVGKITLQRRRMFAFACGLVIGFRFSFALTQTLQFSGSHRLGSVLAFNLGAEACQLIALVLLALALDVLFRRVVAERMGTIIVSGLVIQTAWRSMLDRMERLRLYQFEWPTLTAASEANVLRELMVILILACLVWLLFGALESWLKRNPGDDTVQAPQQRS
jgi:hypothetical protein